MIAGRWIRGDVYPDAGILGQWTWHAVICVGDEEQAWTPALKAYGSECGAITAMKRWRKSGTAHGMVRMNSVPPDEKPGYIQTGEVMGRLPPGTEKKP